MKRIAPSKNPKDFIFRFDKSITPIARIESGEVVEINEGLNDSPELVNQDPHGNGWFIRLKIKDETELEKLMSADGYEKFLEGIED